MARRVALLSSVACLLLAAPAYARVIKSGSVLPPGQSGFVSVAGVANGTGSPHLHDQQSLFEHFKFKPATFDLPGAPIHPKAGVKIVRDKYGVPAITGNTMDNAWWGAGYAIAQDRLFQIEIFRRAAEGKLSEILGKSYLPMDVETRRDFYTPAELMRQYDKLPKSIQGYFLAYRDGVNAWIDEVRSDPTGSKLPGEYVALGIGPPPHFTLVDSLAIGVYLARTIPSGTGEELANLEAFQRIGPRLFSRMLPLHTRHPVITVPRSSGLFPSDPGRTRHDERIGWKRSQRFAKKLPLPSKQSYGTIRESSHLPLLGHTGKPEGSDVWAIRGPHHRAGFFTGPQLGYSIPELLVELEVHGPGFDARGVTAAGVPVVGIGHNKHVAWGETSGESDEDDLYAERLVDATHYRYKGKTRAMSCRNERFTWKPPPTDALDPTGLLGGLPGSGSSGDSSAPAGSQTVQICRTVHGPVQARAGKVAYARRFAIWGREAGTIRGLLKLDRAKSIKDVGRAMRLVTWNENTTAADDRGHIGYWHPGLLPWKPKRWDERLPYPGDGRAEWRGKTGLLPVKSRPHVVDPKQGYLFNWNNKPSAGWTEGDYYSRQRTQGPFHHAGYLGRVVRRVAHERKKFGLLHTASVDRFSGTISEQRPIATPLLRRAYKHSKGSARVVLRTILKWNGSYTRTGKDGKIAAGAGAWQEFKYAAMHRALGRSRGVRLLGATRSSDFDASNGEVYGLRHLKPRGLRRAAAIASKRLRKRFGSGTPSKWRQPRPMAETSSMGAGTYPPFPLFDRGTWQQVVLLGP